MKTRRAGFEFVRRGCIWESSCLHILVLFITHGSFLNFWLIFDEAWSQLCITSFVVLLQFINVEKLLEVGHVVYVTFVVGHGPACSLLVICCACLVVEHGPEMLPCSLLVSHTETVFKFETMHPVQGGPRRFI